MAAIIFISILFTLYNIYITNTSVSMADDRVNYSANFSGIRTSSSLGLEFVFSVVRMMSGDITTVFYITTFLCVVFTLIAYRKYEDAVPSTIFLLFMSQFIFSTFVNLKQSYTSAFASLFFVIAIQEKNLKDRNFCILLIILASIFHPTGFILIPIYFLLRIKTKGYNIYFVYILLMILVLFFEEVMYTIGFLMNPIVPGFASKLFYYFSDATLSSSDSSIFAFIKGFPYYYIAILGFLKRDKLKTKICNYDKYIVITAIGAVFYFASIYEYWLSRTIYLFYLPMFTFFILIMKNTKYKENRFIHWLNVGGSMAFITYRFLALVYINYGGF
jgi:hypothetical protein